MKRLLLVTALPVLLFTACKKDCNNNYESIATITGRDFTKCGCCGGYYIAIDSAQYRFYNLPTGSAINLEQEKLPLRVKITWRTDTSSCNRIMRDLIIVERIEKD